VYFEHGPNYGVTGAEFDPEKGLLKSSPSRSRLTGKDELVPGDSFLNLDLWTCVRGMNLLAVSRLPVAGAQFFRRTVPSFPTHG